MRLSDVKEHSTPVFEEALTSSVPSPMPHHRIVSRGAESPSGARGAPDHVPRPVWSRTSSNRARASAFGCRVTRPPARAPWQVCDLNMTLRRRGGGSPVAPGARTRSAPIPSSRRSRRRTRHR